MSGPAAVERSRPLTPQTPADEPLLKVRDLRVRFATSSGDLWAVRGVSFDVERGRALAIVGESGSGKSATALAIVGLLPELAATVGGSVALCGSELLGASDRALQEVRGGKVGFVFQEPMTSLNPIYRVGSQIGEAIRLHQRASRAEARRRAIELLRRVGVADPERTADAYAHQLSGGMRQRVMIAIAIAAGPRLVIADEPTTALDTTIAAQIMDLLEDLRREEGMSLILVAHDLELVAQRADRVLVFYAGQIVEAGPCAEVLERPRHPYTRLLLSSSPPRAAAQREIGQPGARLAAIEGQVPDLRAPIHGCAFAPRCPSRLPRCGADEPALRQVGEQAAVRCFLYELPVAGPERGQDEL